MNAPEILAAIASGLTLGGGGAWAAWRTAQRRAQAATSKREKALLEKLDEVQHELARRRASDRPGSFEAERTSQREAARAAGFAPGNTGAFERANSIGEMRCNAHAQLVSIVDEVRTAVTAAASAASMASAAAMRVEEDSRQQSDRIEKALYDVSAKFATLGEWKGGVDARLQAAERELGRIALVRGGAAAR